MKKIYFNNIDEMIRSAILEDAPYGDLTSNSLEISGIGNGYFLAKEDFILCGMEVVARVFKILDESVKIIQKYQDGQFIKRGTKFCFVKGDLRALLLGERTALNFLQRLSAIATKTNRAVKLLGKSRTKLLDTRKTTPLFRCLEKYAVKTGGGTNHRMGLSDAILIKDNHIEAVGSISEAIRRARKNCPMKKIEIEVKNIQEFIEAANEKADIIMLDNFTPDDIKRALKLKPKGILTEISGGVVLDNLPYLAKLGVDFVSMGALTHTIKAIDISFEIEQ
ncbi:MAG: carboxylating nicotinate-nucleotide diphosphorylase [Acidobacteria bacterium]|nr:carboxylating nicotinate-nucleotide diphosphorylase [Acidobacteriota bacterium]